MLYVMTYLHAPTFASYSYPRLRLVVSVHADQLSQAIRLARDEIEAVVGRTDAMDWRLDRFERDAVAPTSVVTRPTDDDV